MDVKSTAMLAMIALGAIATLVSIYLAALPKEKVGNRWILLGLLGFLLLGTGGFGTAFMKDYAGFLKEVASLRGAAKDQAVAQVIDDFAANRIPADARALALNVILEDPAPGLEDRINDAITKPATTAEARDTLQRISAEIRRRQDAAAKRAELLPAAPPAPTPESAATTKFDDIDTATLRLWLRDFDKIKPSNAAFEKLDRSAITRLIDERELRGATVSPR